jgi:hypothetical protein
LHCTVSMSANSFHDVDPTTCTCVNSPVKLPEMLTLFNLPFVQNLILQQLSLMRLIQFPHITPHRLAVNLAPHPRPLQSHMRRIQIPGTRTPHRSLEDALLAFLADIIYPRMSVQSQNPTDSVTNILVMILAPSEHPTPYSGRFGKAFLSHLISCRKSHVDRALNSIGVVILLCAQPRLLITQAAHPAAVIGAMTSRR